jgi:membrane-associated phospholipid phosphatase
MDARRRWRDHAPGLATRSPSWLTIAALAGLAIFLIAAALALSGTLRDLDLRATWSTHVYALPGYARLVHLVYVYVGPELSIGYAVAATAWLYTRRLGWLSLSPLAFLITVPIESLLKFGFPQPYEPNYTMHLPLGITVVSGSFPSGHAIRGAFFCAYLAVIWWSRRSPGWKLAAIALVPVAGVIGLSRISLVGHLLSDVVAGLALGASIGILAGQAVALRLRVATPTRPASPKS